jgi:hypothetical protein
MTILIIGAMTESKMHHSTTSPKIFHTDNETTYLSIKLFIMQI